MVGSEDDNCPYCGGEGEIGKGRERERERDEWGEIFFSSLESRGVNCYCYAITAVQSVVFNILISVGYKFTIYIRVGCHLFTQVPSSHLLFPILFPSPSTLPPDFLLCCSLTVPFLRSRWWLWLVHFIEIVHYRDR